MPRTAIPATLRGGPADGKVVELMGVYWNVPDYDAAGNRINAHYEWAEEDGRYVGIFKGWYGKHGKLDDQNPKLYRDVIAERRRRRSLFGDGEGI